MLLLSRAHDLCNRDTLNAVGADGRLLGGVQMCSDPCYQEMIDCVDSPALAQDRSHIQMIADACASEQAECLPIIANLGDYFDEACCTGAGLPACPEGPPTTCTTGCASIFLPFWQDCGSVMEGYVEIATAVDAIRSFNALCEQAHPDLEPEPSLPPPPPPPREGH